ncbi:hypothetical protein L484_020796 [Morus notabilis]|uniref:Uncharacterized protein n=1 Tax=Morus notabilis TaxID=981085 RepID=W9RV09_9ROSA|nr:hypothetical protein L484_020796 [Morus notabilis]
MASVATSEKCVFIDGDDGFEAVDIDSAFLMSLMEELHDQVEVTDEERLKSVIQSLEAEINSSTAVDLDHDSIYMMEPDHDRSISDREDSQACSLGPMDDQDFSVSFDDLDMNRLINMEAVPCSPNHWDMYPFGDHDQITSNDYSADHFTYNRGVVLDQVYGYNSLWQETTHDSVMYE